jgi:hypothetical protein
MLLLPFAVGVSESGPSWAQVPLLVAWLAGYAASYFALLALKTRRPGRVLPQLTVFGSVAVPAAALSLWLTPSLLAFAPLIAVLLGINAWYAWHKDERWIVNDVVAVAEACLLVPITAEAGGASLRTGWLAAGLLFLYFAGTALYVKTMIRERGRVSWRRASLAWHAAAVPLAWLVAWPLGVTFLWFLVRATIFPSFGLRPRTVGLIEVGNCLVLLALVPLAT